MSSDLAHFVITDISMISPLGLDMDHSCVNASAGISRITELERDITSEDESSVTGIKGHLIPFMDGYEHIGRLLRMIALLKKNAKHENRYENIDKTKSGLVIVLPDPSRYTKSEVEDYENKAFDFNLHHFDSVLFKKRIVNYLDFGFDDSNILVMKISEGGIFPALDAGYEKIRSNDWDNFMFCTVDSLLDSYCLQYLFDHGKLFVDDKNTGLIPGEAAVMMMICEREYAKKSGLKHLCSFTYQHGDSSFDMCDAISSHIKIDEMLPEDTIFVHDMNGEKGKANEWGNTFVKLCEKSKQYQLVDTVYPATFWGDTGISNTAAGMCFGISLLNNSKKQYRQIPVIMGNDNGFRGVVMLYKERT